MGGKFDFLNEANKWITEVEKNEKQKKTYNVATDIYKKNNEFYEQNRSKTDVTVQNEIIHCYNKAVDRFFYLSVTLASVVVIMILCKVCL